MEVGKILETLSEKITDAIDKYHKGFKKKILKTTEEVEANTNENNLASAVVVGELINDLDNLRASGDIEGFEVIDGDVYIKYKVGADTVLKKLHDGPSGDITQKLVPGFYDIQYTIMAPTADVTWKLFGSHGYVKLDGISKGYIPDGSPSQSRANGNFSAVRGQVITGICQYQSGSEINITEHFG